MKLRGGENLAFLIYKSGYSGNTGYRKSKILSVMVKKGTTLPGGVVLSRQGFKGCNISKQG